MDRSRYADRCRSETNGKLRRAVFTALRQRIQPPERAGDLGMVVEAMGLLRFDWIDTVSAAGVQHGLEHANLRQGEAELIATALRDAAAECETKEKQQPISVMMAQQKAPTAYARASSGTGTGARQAPALRPRAQAGTALDVALRGHYGRRRAKPRHHTAIDEVVWQGALGTAKERLQEQFELQDLSQHYGTMCALGKHLLEQEIHKEAQGLYDYMIGKIFQRQARKAKAEGYPW